MSLLDKNTNIRLSVKDFGSVAVIIGTVLTVYFSLKADIAEAKELPPPVITKQQFQNSIENTKNDINIVKEDVREIKDMLKKLEDRIYEIK